MRLLAGTAAGFAVLALLAMWTSRELWRAADRVEHALAVVAQVEALEDAARTDAAREALLVWLRRNLRERAALEAQLVVAGRMASVDTLAAGVAHEINNPLAYVAGNLGFVADQLEVPWARCS